MTHPEPSRSKDAFRLKTGVSVEGLTPRVHVPEEGSFKDSLKGTIRKGPIRVFSLRVHVPKEYILWPYSTPRIGTLGPKYILFGYMDPYGDRLGLSVR